MPLFLDQLVAALRIGGAQSNTEIARSAVLHGRDLLRQGLTVSQVVHDYGDVCQSVTDLAMELNAPISTDDFRTLNRCLDDAIAGAVTEFGRGHNQSGIDGEAARGSERLGFLAHELRNLTNTALFEIEDECGGLPPGKIEELFSPFQQRSNDRTGLGLGLAFSRWGAHANEGEWPPNVPPLHSSSRWGYEP